MKKNIDKEIETLRKQVELQRKRVAERSQLLKKMENMQEKVHLSDRPIGRTKFKTPVPEQSKKKVTKRKLKPRGFQIVTPTKIKNEDSRISRHLVVSPKTTKRKYGSYQEALVKHSPENVFVLKNKQKYTSQDEQYRQQTAFLQEKTSTLGMFVMNLLSSVFHDDCDNINKTCVMKDPFLEKIFLSSSQFEIVEKTRWYDEINRMLVSAKIYPSNTALEDLVFMDELSLLIVDFVRKHCAKLVSMFKTVAPTVVIAGPVESGKSSILHLFTKTIVDLLVNDTSEWVETLIFVADLGNLVFPFSDIAYFYSSYVKRLFECICSQRASVAPWKPKLEALFKNVVGSKKTKSVVFPPAYLDRFQQEHLLLTMLTERLRKLWRRKKFAQFLTTTCTLPKLVGEIFGFNRVINIIDDFDVAKVKLRNTGMDSTSTTRHLSFYLKKALSHQNYILTTNNLACLRRKGMDIEDVDLLGISSFFSTLDLIDIEQMKGVPKTLTLLQDGYSEVPIYGSDLRSKKTKKVFSLDCLRGVPAYLAHVLKYVQCNKQTIVVTEAIPVNESEINLFLRHIRTFVKAER